MTLTARYIETAESSDLTFSVCSLVRSQEKYDRLLSSFERLGFTPSNSEFLAADNRHVNRFDGYSWHKTLLAEARGRFVIFSHDDVELIDQGYAELLACANWLDANDPLWLVAGVAGGVWHMESRRRRPALSLRISDKFGENRSAGSVPCRVESLDECFMMMRRTRPVISSYGPDLCLQAELLGGRAYTIDFHLRHNGEAVTGNSFRAIRRRFAIKYGPFFPGRRLNTVNGVIELGGARRSPGN
jgi:hypothetical protein